MDQYQTYLLLLAHAFRCDTLRARLAVADFQKYVKRFEAGEPVAYITGLKEFYGREFEVTPDVLIPRPDTETLVELALKRLPAGEKMHVIDACTGSGCVGITLALERPDIRVVAIDISPAAAEVARRNAAKLGVADRFEVRVGDLLGPVIGEQFDLLVSNPPYIKPADMPGLMPEVHDFEPHLALEGLSEDGVGLHRRLIEQAAQVLKPGAFVLLEIGYNQGLLFKNRGTVYQDDAGNDRVVEIINGG
jgi:release factor glutamine methyltransferase